MISDLTAPEHTGAESANPGMQTEMRSNISFHSTFTPEKSDDSRSKASPNPIFSSAHGLQAEVLPSFASSDVGIPAPVGGPYARVSSHEAFVKRQKQVDHSPRLFPSVAFDADKATPLRRQQLPASARRPLPSASATTTPTLRLLQQRSFTPTGMTSASLRTYQREPASNPGLRPLQETSLFRLFDNDNFSSPAVPANKLPRPSKQPTSQRKVSTLFDEPCSANKANFSVPTPASSSAEECFAQANHQASTSPAPSLSGPQEAQIPLRRASTRASQRQPKTTTAATLATKGQRQEQPPD